MIYSRFPSLLLPWSNPCSAVSSRGVKEPDSVSLVPDGDCSDSCADASSALLRHISPSPFPICIHSSPASGMKDSWSVQPISFGSEQTQGKAQSSCHSCLSSRLVSLAVCARLPLALAAWEGPEHGNMGNIVAFVAKPCNRKQQHMPCEILSSVTLGTLVPSAETL